jgi:hypothetical protein
VKLPSHPTIPQIAEAEIRPTAYDYNRINNEYCFNAIVRAAYDESEKAGHPYTQPHKHEDLADVKTWLDLGCDMLASIPRDILEAVLDGTLACKVETKHGVLHEYFDKTTDPDPENWNAWIARSQSEFAPCIYLRQLVDAQGLSPEAHILRSVARRLREYVSGDPEFHETNAKIDSMTRGKSTPNCISRGLHHHLKGVQERVKQTLTFASALDQYVDTVAPADSTPYNAPIPHPLSYIGFAVNQEEREKAHKTHSSTNWISALVDDILKFEYKGVFGFKTFPICYLASYNECRIGEELFTRICSGYWYTGRGFNIAPAGISVKSANLDDISYGEATRMWGLCVQFRRREEHFWTNIDYQMDVAIPRWEKVLEAQSKDPAEERRKEKEDFAKQYAIRRGSTVSFSTELLKKRLEDHRQSHDRLIRTVEARPDIPGIKEALIADKQRELAELENEIKEEIESYEEEDRVAQEYLGYLPDPDPPFRDEYGPDGFYLGTLPNLNP